MGVTAMRYVLEPRTEPRISKRGCKCEWCDTPFRPGDKFFCWDEEDICEDCIEDAVLTCLRDKFSDYAEPLSHVLGYVAAVAK